MKLQKANQAAAANPPAAIISQNSLINKLRGIKTAANPPAANPPAANPPASTLINKLRGIKTAANPPAANPPAAAAIPPHSPDINALIAALIKQSGKIQEGMNITLEKFAEVESMRNEIEYLKKEVIESKQLLAVYCATYQKMESESNALAVDSAKNIRAIMAELNTVKQIRGELKTAANPPAANPPAVVNRKAIPPAAAANPPAAIALDSHSLYAAFQAQFGGQFCGSKELNHISEFERIIEAIPESNDIAEIEKAIRQEWTKKRSEGTGQYCAAKSLGAMVQALILTLTAAGMISPPAANPPAANPPAAIPPARVVNAESLGQALELNPQELRELIKEFRTGENWGKSRIPQIRTFIQQYGIENGIEIDGQTLSDIIRFTFGQ